ncbi:hypothetical protein RQP46_009150 [Phenoliferia psychrophenolica]
MAKGTKKSKSVSAPPPAAADSSSSDSSSTDSDSDADVKGVAAEKGKGKEAPPPARPSKKFQPPKGLSAVKGLASRSGADWDAINRDPEVELWAIRVPNGIKPKHLDGVTIQLPADYVHNSVAPLAHFKAKKVEYDIYLADAGAGTSAAGKRLRDEDQDDDAKPAVGVKGGEEMRALVPLLPKHAAGDKLFQAPRPLTRHLLITRSVPAGVLSHLPSSTSSLIASQPSPVPGAILSAEELLDPTVAQAKKIVRAQPAALKFRIALGGQGAVGGRGDFQNVPVVKEAEELAAEVKMVVDGGEDVEAPATPVASSPKKAKKEKREGESPKKKKVKAEQ